MLKALLTLVFAFTLTTTFSQPGEWTWMKGTAAPFGGTGTWGIQGVPDAANNPPSVYEACEWKDKNDNLWVFGGVNNSVIIYYSTLWKYDIATNMWVWVSGTNTTNQPGVYGTQGVPDPSNYPGGRGWGSLSWTDTSGNFWLFGGYGYDMNGNVGVLGDLWKYDVSINEWTWMKGPSTFNYLGSYGTQGVAASTNNPPARQETSCAWVDSANNLWMFGGWTFLGNGDDLWKYDISTNMWTWMKGHSTPNHYGTYGTIGVSSPLNNPGSRAAYARWIDKENNLWLYGGNGYSANGNGFLGDLWKYTMSTNEWTWMSGLTGAFLPGVYGNKCEWSVNHFPSNKYETRACWVDDCGYFFMYGGTSYNGHQGDLWLYNYLTNEWTWVNGDNTTNTNAVPGTQGVSSPANKPGLRTGSNSWIDQSGNLWLFGGYVCSDDMWKFVPDYSCIGTSLCALPLTVSFSASDTTLCEKFCTEFFDQSANNPTSWEWLFQGGDPSTANIQNPDNICYNNPGTYDVTLITTHANGSDTLTLDDYITVYPTPPIPVITQAGYTLTSSPADFYQWQLNTIDIPGATNQSYTVTQSGFYTVIVSDVNGCVNSAGIDILISGIEVSHDQEVSVYPNPSGGTFSITFNDSFTTGKCSIELFNAIGQKVFIPIVPESAGILKRDIVVNGLTSGIYFLTIHSGNSLIQKKIVVMN